MAAELHCSACVRALAQGTCPKCSEALCLPCYHVHNCAFLAVPVPEAAPNLQCSQCYTEPAVCLCICKHPCPVFCQDCYGKHSSGLPIHFSIPLELRNSLVSKTLFDICKSRYANTQRLYVDMTTAIGQIAEFRKAFERKIEEVIEKIAEIRGKMNAEIERAQKDLQEQEAWLMRSFTDILMSKACPCSEICRLIDANYPQVPTFQQSLDFSPVLLSLSQAASFHSPLLSQLRPQLPVQASFSVPSQRLCSHCEKPFASAPPADIPRMRNLHNGLWTDFCSFACLDQFKKLYLELTKS